MSRAAAVCPAPSRLSLPQKLGPYRIVGQLGKGGMNHVLRAVHSILQREVALKILAPQQRADQTTLQRFKAEARAGAAIDHRNVATCFDAGRQGEWCYLAHELVDGGDLEQERRRRGDRFPERLAIALARDIARGLAAVHEAGFVHRDIKPANILLDQGLTPKLADFGIAVDINDQPRGEVLGSLAFMSPEQIRGRALDGRSDCYALCATLYALVTGTVPFKRRIADLKAGTVPIVAPPSCRRVRPRLSRGLDALLRRGLAIAPADRHADAASLADALDALLAPVEVPVAERSPIDPDTAGCRSDTAGTMDPGTAGDAVCTADELVLAAF